MTTYPAMRWTAARPVQGSDHLHQLLSKPKNRATVSRILNAESAKIAAAAQQLAEQEVHRRPDSRRTRESLEHGREYHDSFEVVPAKLLGVDKLRAAVVNTHPMARAVENGTPAHEITAREAPQLRFPFNRGPRGGVGVLGGFAVNWGGNSFIGQRVSHTGARGHRILARTLQAYRRSQGAFRRR